MKDISVQNGSIYVKVELQDLFDQVKVVLEKSDILDSSDIQALLEVYRRSFVHSAPALKPHFQNIGRVFSQNISFDSFIVADNHSALIQKLEDRGCLVYSPKESDSKLGWDSLAGYEKIKRTIEDSVLFTLTHPDIFQKITESTRDAYEVNKPKCILFEGPPGCGKTTSAKIMSQTLNVPLANLPIEAILSKYYGQSEAKLAEIFEICQEFQDCILFIDEVDSLATSRDGGIHEATRRVLSTLLRKIDSFETKGNVLVICATNRKEDLDAALLSRVDLSIKFDLPDYDTRIKILNKYAKQLSSDELSVLAEMTNSMSGRDLYDICRDAERRWGSRFIRKEVPSHVPQAEVYEECISDRKVQFSS